MQDFRPDPHLYAWAYAEEEDDKREVQDAIDYNDTSDIVPSMRTQLRANTSRGSASRSVHVAPSSPLPPSSQSARGKQSPTNDSLQQGSVPTVIDEPLVIAALGPDGISKVFDDMLIEDEANVFDIPLEVADDSPVIDDISFDGISSRIS